MGYATFTLSIIFGVTYPIVHFQAFWQKEIFQAGAILINTNVLSFLLYGQKVIRMLLYPEYNTKEHFHIQSWNECYQNTLELKETLRK